LYLGKPRSGKSHQFRGAIVIKLLHFQNVLRSQENERLEFSNSPGLKSVFEKLRFRDGLVWTVSPTVEIKLRFRDGLVWTVSPTAEIKLRFRDGLLWTVSPTVEIKLRFRDRLLWTVSPTVEIKLRFRDGLVWTGKPNRKNKAAFSNFSNTVWKAGPTVRFYSRDHNHVIDGVSCA